MRKRGKSESQWLILSTREKIDYIEKILVGYKEIKNKKKIEKQLKILHEENT